MNICGASSICGTRFGGIVLTFVLVAGSLRAQHEGQPAYDWLPVGSSAGQAVGVEQALPAIAVTKTPKATADLSKFTREYVLELKKFNISNDGTHAVETSKGLNDALQYAKTLGANRIVFPKGTYLISETDPVVIDHKDTIIDLNGATLQMNTNGLERYAIVAIVDGAESVRLTNGTLRGDKDTHDFKTIKGTHEWGEAVMFYGGMNLEVDHLKLCNATGDGAAVDGYGNRTRAELFAMIFYSVQTKELEQGGFSDLGAKTASKEKTRSIKPFDITKCNGEFELGYAPGTCGYPYVKDRNYQACFYDAQMKFIGKIRCLQYKKVAIPLGAEFMHLEFNQPDVKCDAEWCFRITNFRRPRDVHFHDNECVGNKRLGLADVGQRWVIENNLFEGNGSTSPAYGVDFEDGMELMQDIVFRNNKFKGNIAGDLVVCGGSEMIFEGNEFEKDVHFNYGRLYNFEFRKNKFMGGPVGYTTRTGVGQIHDNYYQNCPTLAIVFDTKAVADGFYRKPGQTVATPPLRLENETLVNVKKVTGTYFDFVNAKMKNVAFVAGADTRLVHFKNCEFDGVSIEYEAKGPAIDVKIENCRGEIEQKGAGLNRRKTNP